MNIINTYADIGSVFDIEHFNIEKWKTYIDKCVPGAKKLCIDDMQECVDAGYSWQKDFLPILDNVKDDSAMCKEAINSFQTVIGNLDERIAQVFNRTVNVDVILYIGLCNGAGWVTEINGTTSVLLGLEKILELGWVSIDDMTGLIIHELGHVYQSQYGVLHEKTDNLADKYIWQLFTEGVAMVFEQKVVGNDEYFHQDKNGWKSWCDCNKEKIKQSFFEDLMTMTDKTQRYFGDWVGFEGYGDVGYYLGTMFVRFLLQNNEFDKVIKYNLCKVKDEYSRFMNYSGKPISCCKFYNN